MLQPICLTAFCIFWNSRRATHNKTYFTLNGVCNTTVHKTGNKKTFLHTLEQEIHELTRIWSQVGPLHLLSSH